MTPTWILDLLAALMLVVAAVSAVRLVVARPWRPGSVIIDTDIAHLLMAIAMAGLLTSSLRTLPDTAWEVIFGLMIVWYAGRVLLDARANGVRALAGGHCAQHLVHSSAMLYMFPVLTSSSAAMAGMTGMAGMAGMSGGSSSLMVRYPTSAFFFALVLIGYSIWDLDQLSARRYGLVNARVALTRARAGVPAMAGAESATTSFSGPRSATAVTDPVTDPDADDRPGDGIHVVACGADVTVAGAATGGAIGGFLLSPAVTVGCRITMSVAMVFMLMIAI